MAMNSTAFANKKQQQMLDMETDKNPAVNYSIAKGSPNTAPVLSFPSGAGYDSYLASLSASTNEMLARINVTSMQASARKMLDEAIAVFHTAQDEEVGFESLGESDGEDNDEEETLTDKMDLSAFLPTRLRREDSTASVVSASEEQGQQQQQQMESHALWNSPWTPHDLDSSSFTSHAVGIVPAPVRSASPAVSNVSSNNNNNNNVGSSSSSNNASVSINMPSSLLPPDPSLANLANSVDSLPATILQVQSYPLLDEMTSSADAHNNYSSLPSPPSTEPSSPVIPVRKVVIKRSRELDLA